MLWSFDLWPGGVSSSSWTKNRAVFSGAFVGAICYVCDYSVLLPGQNECWKALKHISHYSWQNWAQVETRTPSRQHWTHHIVLLNVFYLYPSDTTQIRSPDLKLDILKPSIPPFFFASDVNVSKRRQSELEITSINSIILCATWTDDVIHHDLN